MTSETEKSPQRSLYESARFAVPQALHEDKPRLYLSAVDVYNMLENPFTGKAELLLFSGKGYKVKGTIRIDGRINVQHVFCLTQKAARAQPQFQS